MSFCPINKNEKRIKKQLRQGYLIKRTLGIYLNVNYSKSIKQ